jgi:hypothetical protein
MFRQIALWAGALLVLVTSLGCESNNPVHPVRGKVTFEGQPLAGGGSIALIPLVDQPGQTAGGEIAEDGSYKLSTYKDGDGSMAGEFRVVIYQVTEKEPEITEDGQAVAKAASSVPMEDRIPTVYADAQNSPLRAKVDGSTNEINFDLKRNPQ